MSYFKNRYYSSALGRFLTRDTYESGVQRYSYAEDSPTMKVDSRGLCAGCPDLCPQAGKKQNVHTTAFGYAPVGRTSDDEFKKTVDDLTTAATAILAINSLRKASGKGNSEGAGGVEKAGDLAKKLQARLKQAQGVDIIVEVSYDICENESCWVFWDRLNWKTKTKKWTCNSDAGRLSQAFAIAGIRTFVMKDEAEAGRSNSLLYPLPSPVHAPSVPKTQSFLSGSGLGSAGIGLALAGSGLGAAGSGLEAAW